MAFFCEKETVLRSFRDGLDIYYQQSKYEIGDSIRTASPRGEGKLPYSRSLEQYSTLLAGEKGTPDGGALKGNSKQANNGQNAQCQVIAFDSSKFNPAFTFAKVPIVVVPDDVVSELSKNIVRVKFIQFKVYFPKKCTPFFVTVSQPESATVQDVMQQALSQFNETSASPLNPDINSHKFYMADDDGSPEEFGVLGAGQVASRMGKEFTLVPQRESTQATSSDRAPLVIYLPGKEKATVPYLGTMKVAELIRKVCDRRNMNPAEYHLETGAQNILSSEFLVQDLSPDEVLELCPNLVEGAEEDVQEISSYHETFKYKVFEVLYRRKNFSLGIDGEHIQIFKKRTGFTREKKELYPFSDLRSVVEGKGSKAFTFTWADGRQDLFESSQRKEILSKVEGIQQRKRDTFF